MSDSWNRWNEEGDERKKGHILLGPRQPELKHLDDRNEWEVVLLLLWSPRKRKSRSSRNVQQSLIHRNDG